MPFSSSSEGPSGAAAPAALRHVAAALSRAWNRAADFVFPRICPLCGGVSDSPGRFVCRGCMENLRRDFMGGPVCDVCGVAIDAKNPDGICHECRRRLPAFDMARSALPYDGPARRLVHEFKYHRGTWLVGDLADILEGAARAGFDVRQIDLVAPVPLHPAKFILRSYNQSALLAGALAKRLGVACSPSALERVRDTQTQTHLSPALRAENVRNVFRVPFPEQVRSRTVLVIDDVMTTGATMGEISRVLKAAGAWRVWALSLCRA